MTAATHPLRTAGSALRVALALLLAGAAVGVPAATGAEFAARVLAARQDAGADPHRGLATLRALRGDALAKQQPELRLLIDEAECRIASDLDAAQAKAVADAGIAFAQAHPTPQAREPLLRLRACRAGMLVELGDAAAGRAEFEALLGLTQAPGDVGIHALVKLERGVHRSRAGDWLRAQPDLLAACEQLALSGPAADHTLCLGHLANHYKRVGDADEALRLFNTLSMQARQRGAVYDDAIYTFGAGQVLHAQNRWADAITSFEFAARASQQLGDATGVGYAEHAIALSLLKLGRPQEALAHAERAVELIDRQADPREAVVALITRAEVLAALGRPADTLAELERVEPAVRQRGELPMMATWHGVRADAMRQLARWREAYQSLAEARGIEEQLQRQKLSDQSARMRMQFNRARDTEELSALRQLNEQGQHLRRTQALALVLFVIVLVGVVVVAVRKFRQARHLQRLASTDELTGLANRRALLAFADDALAQAQRSGTPLAMLMIDIDHFKRINDSHGHATGDQVLRHVARVLGAGLRDRDRLGRLGGEEFLAVLPGAALPQAQQVAERMRGAIDATPLIGPSGEVRFTVSIGVAGARDDESATALIDRADAALYRAKNGGRNTVAVDDATELPRNAA